MRSRLVQDQQYQPNVASFMQAKKKEDWCAFIIIMVAVNYYANACS